MTGTTTEKIAVSVRAVASVFGIVLQLLIAKGVVTERDVRRVLDLAARAAEETEPLDAGHEAVLAETMVIVRALRHDLGSPS